MTTASPSITGSIRVAYTKRNASDKWNGFSYQGKVGLLLGLISLKTKVDLNDEELGRWYFQYEVSEDVTLANDTEIISKHQVKSYSSKSSHLFTTYKSAIDDFETEGTPEDGRFLHVATAIADFQVNDNKVQLYFYPDGQNFCKLVDDQIFTFCKNEILLIRSGIDESFAENIGYFLLHQVSVVLNEAHDSLGGNGEILPARISLLDLKNYIFNSSADVISKSVDEARLKNSITKIWDDHRDYVDGSEINEDKISAISDLMCTITSLPYEDVLDFLCFIHPSINFDEYGRNISIEGFKDVFLEVLTACNPEYDCDKARYKVNGEYYVPTTINRSNTPKNQKEVAQGIINNYNPNSKRLLFEKSAIINANIDGGLLELAGLNNRHHAPSNSGLEHIMTYTGSSLMNVASAVEAINTESEES